MIEWLRGLSPLEATACFAVENLLIVAGAAGVGQLLRIRHPDLGPPLRNGRKAGAGTV